MPTNNFTVLYFAALAEAAGKNSETISDSYQNLSDLYAALKTRHNFALNQEQLRVARNQAFCDWGESPQAGDEIAFIPPVSGG